MGIFLSSFLESLAGMVYPSKKKRVHRSGSSAAAIRSRSLLTGNRFQFPRCASNIAERQAQARVAIRGPLHRVGGRNAVNQDKHLDEYGLSVQSTIEISHASLESSLLGQIGWLSPATIPFGDASGINANRQPRERERLELLTGGLATRTIQYGLSVQITIAFELVVGCKARGARLTAAKGKGRIVRRRLRLKRGRAGASAGNSQTDAEAKRQARSH